MRCTPTCIWTCWPLIGLFAGASAGQRIIYVNANAGGAADGTTWVHASNDLQEAISEAAPGDRIWVAAGVYRPGNQRTDRFELKERVEIYGGLAGNEDPNTFNLALRDLVLNETILDGEIGAAGAADNVFHVVVAENVSRSAILDGFTIVGANADGLSVSQQDYGGGFLLINASPTIRHCLIRDHLAGTRGAGVHIAGGSTLFSHCRFVANHTTGTQELSNRGGGVFCAGTAESTAFPEFVNCLFVGNQAGVGNGGSGAAIYVDDNATATVINCTLLHNRADTLTGGVLGPTTVVNSIVYGNEDRNGRELTAQLRDVGSVSWSLVEGGWPGMSNLDGDPIFQDALGPDGVAGTRDDDPRLATGSPCIDAGDNAAWPVTLAALDLDRRSRFVSDPDGGSAGRIDIGAFERQKTCTTSAQCDDGLFCNGAEECVGGACRAGVALDCSDFVGCTRDSCDESSRGCMHQPDGNLCDNGVFCDGAEICHPAQGCLTGPARDCNDGIDCTADLCDSAGHQCVHIADDTQCDDGFFCYGQEACDSSAGCRQATRGPCDDEEECTLDGCDEEQEHCTHEPTEGSCQDDLFCNGIETCTTSGCVGVPPCASGQICDEDADLCVIPDAPCQSDLDCNDDNPCTDDRCLIDTCAVSFHQHPCDDNDTCTIQDECHLGVCRGQPVDDCDPPPTDDDDPSNPPDSDNDGVSDPVDHCHSTPTGTIVDELGCGVEETPPGRGVFEIPQRPRCGACGALGSIGAIFTYCVPGLALILRRPRGARLKAHLVSKLVRPPAGPRQNRASRQP